MVIDGERVKALRTDKQWTQKALADRVGVHTSRICEIENTHACWAKTTLSIRALRNLAIQLNTSTDYLLALTDNPAPLAPYSRPKIGDALTAITN